MAGGTLGHILEVCDAIRHIISFCIGLFLLEYAATKNRCRHCAQGMRKEGGMILLLKRLRSHAKGVTMVEYALIAALVAIAAVTILATLGTTVSTVFSNVNSNMS